LGSNLPAPGKFNHVVDIDAQIAGNVLDIRFAQQYLERPPTFSQQAA
jgi:hypothetical protein